MAGWRNARVDALTRAISECDHTTGTGNQLVINWCPGSHTTRGVRSLSNRLADYGSRSKRSRGPAARKVGCLSRAPTWWRAKFPCYKHVCRL